MFALDLNKELNKFMPGIRSLPYSTEDRLPLQGTYYEDTLDDAT